MSTAPTSKRAPVKGNKDMYWFAHGGIESNSDKCLVQRSTTPGECEDESIDSNSPTWKSLPERRVVSDEKSAPCLKDSTDGGNLSSAPSSFERDDKLRLSGKHMAAEERRKQLWEAEQERNDAVLRKHMEREAALEARRNAQRSNIAFAFGSSIPRNVEQLHVDQGGDSEKLNRYSPASGLMQKEENYETHHERRSVSPFNYSGHNFLIDDISPRSNSSQSCTYSERKSIFPPSWLVGSGALIGEDVMSRSMTAAVPTVRGRRKNDLMPTVPYNRTSAPRPSTSSSTRKRSVSMTRLDQLAQPRRHYVEANKASSTASSGASSMLKENVRSPTRPLSSASEQSAGSGRVAGVVHRRVRSSPRKPRPVSIAGTVPDQRNTSEIKVSPAKRSYTPNKKPQASEVKKAPVNTVKAASPKPAEKAKSAEKVKEKAEKAKTSPRSTSTPKPSKQSTPKQPVEQSVKQAVKTAVKQVVKVASPKTPTAKKSVTNKKKADILVPAPTTSEVTESHIEDTAKPSSPPSTPPPDSSASAECERNAKRIISEEEAKAALAEKRRLAREQAEKEAELERQRQEELKLQEEERIRKEEEEQKRMEEEHLHLIEEHRRAEEEKLKKAIEEQERKEEEERARREEELRLKAEQEKKAQEEAEKQRIELEEKLRKEEEERAERKKRLEKIMSRTRGKTGSGTSPSGSVSGSDQLDSGENQGDAFSSGANSLDSNEAADMRSGPSSLESKKESSTGGNSLEVHPTYEITSENESLNSNDLMMPVSETASQDNSIAMYDETNLKESSLDDYCKSDEAVVEPVCAEVVFQESQASENQFETQVLDAENKTVEDSPAIDKSSEVENVSSEQDLFVPQSSETVNQFEESSLLQSVTDETSLYKSDDDNASTEIRVETLIDESPVVKSETEMDSNPAGFDNFEQAVVDTADVTLSFTEGWKEEKSSSSPTEKSDIKFDSNLEEYDSGYAHPLEKYEIGKSVSESVTEQTVVEPEINEYNSHYSASSDMKLPDPIYETTSDEGSVSSDRHHPDFNAYILHGDHTIMDNYKEVFPVPDDVFSEKEITGVNLQAAYQDPNFFMVKEDEGNCSADDDIQKHMLAYESQFQIGMEQDADMVENFYAHDSATNSPAVFEQTHEIHDENVVKPNIAETNIYQFESAVPEVCGISSPEDNDMNTEKIVIDDMVNASPDVTNPFADNEYQKISEFDFCADKENVQFASQIPDNNADFNVMSHISSEEHVQETEGNSTFIEKTTLSDEVDTVQYQDYSSSSIFQAGEFVSSEQVSDIKNQTVPDNSSNLSSDELINVTLIKSDNNEDCIGIISSVDHDLVSNDFPKPTSHNEKLKSNFEYTSITDSEDSSLDSNLSQVMTVEESEKDTTEGLNHVESNQSSAAISNTVEQPDQLYTYNSDSILKSNGNHVCASEIISNGHRLESSEQIVDKINEFHEYVQLDGNNISSVDHPKSNIFENVDAIDFSKVSPDPFLAKGSSTQISGNPFLLQDDQKQVLMTSDFFN